VSRALGPKNWRKIADLARLDRATQLLVRWYSTADRHPSTFTFNHSIAANFDLPNSRPTAEHTIRQELTGVLAFVGVIWFVFVLQCVLPVALESYGITPRTLSGLIGIPVSPFLHANLGHLVANTLPLIVLLMLLAGSKAKSWTIVAAIVVLGGALLWILGRQATHIGASGLIYGLIAFLIMSGIWERRIIPLFVSLIVGFTYGGALLSGIVPGSNSEMSWDGHLFGAIAGVAVAYVTTRKKRDRATPVNIG
jgi:membrane associated rhomboid family serine protease